VTGLSQEPSRSATLAALEARGKSGITILDLDYRPMFWSSREEARRWVQEALRHADVAVGNEDEWETAGDATAAFVVRKRGPRGVHASRGDESVEVPPAPVDVVNGLGAGDAFGGALCHGLLADWDLERMMRFCNAAGAIVASRLSCADAMPSEREVLAKLGESVNV